MPAWLQIVVAVIAIPSSVWTYYKIWQEIRTEREAKHRKLVADMQSCLSVRKRIAPEHKVLQGYDCNCILEVSNSADAATAWHVRLEADGQSLSEYTGAAVIGGTDAIGAIAPGLSHIVKLDVSNCPDYIRLYWKDDAVLSNYRADPGAYPAEEWLEIPFVSVEDI